MNICWSLFKCIPLPYRPLAEPTFNYGGLEMTKTSFLTFLGRIWRLIKFSPTLTWRRALWKLLEIISSFIKKDAWKEVAFLLDIAGWERLPRVVRDTFPIKAHVKFCRQANSIKVEKKKKSNYLPLFWGVSN